MSRCVHHECFNINFCVAKNATTIKVTGTVCVCVCTCMRCATLVALLSHASLFFCFTLRANISYIIKWLYASHCSMQKSPWVLEHVITWMPLNTDSAQSICEKWNEIVFVSVETATLLKNYLLHFIRNKSFLSINLSVIIVPAPFTFVPVFTLVKYPHIFEAKLRKRDEKA